MQDSAKLLIVDDDQMMLDFAGRAVTTLGYSTILATDAASALRLLEADPDIQAIIVDLRLGTGPTGAEFARTALGKWPSLGVLLTSGDPGSLRMEQLYMPDGVEILAKPYRRAELAARISSVLSERCR